MLDIAWIGFLMMIVGSLLLLACGWIQLHTQKRILKTLPENKSAEKIERIRKL